jgi:hypothetical protein
MPALLIRVHCWVGFEELLEESRDGPDARRELEVGVYVQPDLSPGLDLAVQDAP